MPYIKKEMRDALQSGREDPQTAGDLNYQITELIQDYALAKGLTYQVINDIIGALEGAKLEFYRRVAVPYEDKKIEDNGDVYVL